MKISYHRWYSHRLGRDMELKVYGHAGKPIIIFPTMAGRFFQAEDEGIYNAIHSFIEKGQLFCVAVDSVDGEAWANKDIHPQQRGERHQQYEAYILKEVLPFIQSLGFSTSSPGTIGFSMGAYHAANFFFKHPHIFDTTIAISGIYNLQLLTGTYTDDLVYFNSPNIYLKNLDEPVILDQIRKGKIIISCGQGAWEEDMVSETKELQSILEDKKIPAWVDIWGFDVNHDWPWWLKMLPYFLSHIFY